MWGHPSEYRLDASASGPVPTETRPNASSFSRRPAAIERSFPGRRWERALICVPAIREARLTSSPACFALPFMAKGWGVFGKASTRSEKKFRGIFFTPSESSNRHAAFHRPLRGGTNVAVCTRREGRVARLCPGRIRSLQEVAPFHARAGTSRGARES